MNALEASNNLIYDPTTGVLCWSRDRGSAKAGMQAGYVSDTGYRRIQLLGKEYPAHRLAWLIHYGAWPQNEIDHINGNKLDNRISNLRDVSVSQNRQNLIHARATNKSSGLLGAYLESTTGRWRSQIRINGKIKHLGTFDTAESAHEAYVAAKRLHHSGCTI